MHEPGMRRIEDSTVIAETSPESKIRIFMNTLNRIFKDNTKCNIYPFWENIHLKLRNGENRSPVISLSLKLHRTKILPY